MSAETKWIAPTKRRPLTTKERTAIFMRHNGVCGLCSMKITAGQEWEAEHPVPIWASGSDNREDLVPVHRRCHKSKTAVEASQRAKEARVRAKHIGAVVKKPFPGARQWKRKIDGTTVRRGEA